MVRGVRLVWVVACASCGARTELYEPPLGDASVPDVARDVSPRDVGVDSPPDVTVRDVAIDAPVNLTGCADGTREGFTDITTFPDIAGCSGGFRIPGVMPFNPPTAPACPTFATSDSVHPACNLQAGNTGAVPSGAGCNVADLCEVGWHVCNGSDDVMSRSPSGCTGATQPTDPPLFFATRQSSNGCYDCATGTRTDSDCNSMSCTTGCLETADTSNDVFGCGNFGKPQPFTDCDPLDVTSDNLCIALSGTGWSCTDDGSGFCEAYAIVHTDSSNGGVLCCRD